MSQASDDSQAAMIGSNRARDSHTPENTVQISESSDDTDPMSSDMDPMSDDVSSISDETQIATIDAEWLQPQKLPTYLREHLSKIGLEGFEGVPQSQLQEVLKVAGPNLTIQDPVTGLATTLNIQAMAASENPSVIHLNYSVPEEVDGEFQRKLEQGLRLE